MLYLNRIGWKSWAGFNFVSIHMMILCCCLYACYIETTTAYIYWNKNFQIILNYMFWIHYISVKLLILWIYISDRKHFPCSSNSDHYCDSMSSRGLFNSQWELNSERKEITTEFKAWLNIIKELRKFYCFLFSPTVAIWIVFSKLVLLVK